MTRVLCFWFQHRPAQWFYSTSDTLSLLSSIDKTHVMASLMVFKALYVYDVCRCVFPLTVQNVVRYGLRCTLISPEILRRQVILPTTVFIGYVFKCRFHKKKKKKLSLFFLETAILGRRTLSCWAV